MSWKGRRASRKTGDHESNPGDRSWLGWDVAMKDMKTDSGCNLGNERVQDNSSLGFWVWISDVQSYYLTFSPLRLLSSINIFSLKSLN